MRQVRRGTAGVRKRKARVTVSPRVRLTRRNTRKRNWQSNEKDNEIMSTPNVTPSLPQMPNTDTQDVNQELNTSLNPNAGAAPVPQNHHYAQPSVAQAMTAPAKVPAPYPTPTAPGVPMISPDHTDTRVVPQSV